jgi:hypothetical protein
MENFAVKFFSGMQKNNMSTVLRLSLAFGLMGTTNEALDCVQFDILKFFKDLNYLLSVILDPYSIRIRTTIVPTNVHKNIKISEITILICLCACVVNIVVYLNYIL